MNALQASQVPSSWWPRPASSPHRSRGRPVPGGIAAAPLADQAPSPGS
ncbi:hypothetical protein [Brachybacterium sp. EE-P12]|uniref:Uncharacterized protein n=1 Tax=Candidatus Brachybacterium intestinipullorum TaxID=2838512 RepID=A0A9D2THR3_9MICO|nr:hypothetical protein [Brachybacterium sp. EE-P12]HJC70750.1 hypothetical protein [Candidatus Brachybacterium intestinipullorum]